MKFSNRLPQRRRGEAAFTMVEIALSIAVVAFAMVAILGVLPTYVPAVAAMFGVVQITVCAVAAIAFGLYAKRYKMVDYYRSTDGAKAPATAGV